MPKRTGKSGLVGRLGAKGQEAFDKHKDDSISYGAGSDLPEGIEGGVAQLVECKFDTYERGDNKGESYFYAAGVVKQPKEIDGINIEGLRTQLMEPVCETPNRSRSTIDEHLDWVLNEFRKLGIKTSEVGFEDLEDIAAVLVEEAPHFRYRTWKGTATKQWPNPRVNHEWRGVCQYAEIEDGGDDNVIDETGDEPQDAPGIDDLPVVEDDMRSLAAAADQGDEAAQTKVAEAAEAVGVDSEQYATWTEVAKATEAGSRTEASVDSRQPEKGQVCSFKPPGARKPVECEITAVFGGKEACNLKSLDDGKSFKSVGWDQLDFDS